MKKLYHPNSFLEEGVDHINISNQSKIHLGKLLDPSYFKVINYPHIGKFNSVLNLWYWLKSGSLDDRLRFYTGVNLKTVALNTACHNKVTNFRAIIAYATYLKIKDYPTAIRDLRAFNEEMQFASYYVPRGTMVRMCSGYAALIVDVADFIRSQIVKDEPICFDGIATEPGDSQYFYLEPFLKYNIGKATLS